MTARRLTLFVSILPLLVLLAALLSLGACAGPIALYHDVEGGAIARPLQAPPGQDRPYPNLADVPATYKPAAPGAQDAITAQARQEVPGVSPANPAALEGLDLPTAPPPLPPGLHIPAAPPPAAPPAAKPAAPKASVGPPVALSFAAHNAVLAYADNHALAALVAHRGGAHVIAGGFGDDVSLALAIRRAQRVAAALTALGVPPRDIRMVANAKGSGGFVQLLY
jgi:hypothetical protein